MENYEKKFAELPSVDRELLVSINKTEKTVYGLILSETEKTGAEGANYSSLQTKLKNELKTSATKYIPIFKLLQELKILFRVSGKLIYYRFFPWRPCLSSVMVPAERFNRLSRKGVLAKIKNIFVRQDSFISPEFVERTFLKRTKVALAILAHLAENKLLRVEQRNFGGVTKRVYTNTNRTDIVEEAASSCAERTIERVLGELGTGFASLPKIKILCPDLVHMKFRKNLRTSKKLSKLLLLHRCAFNEKIFAYQIISLFDLQKTRALFLSNENKATFLEANVEHSSCTYLPETSLGVFGESYLETYKLLVRRLQAASSVKEEFVVFRKNLNRVLGYIDYEPLRLHLFYKHFCSFMERHFAFKEVLFLDFSGDVLVDSTNLRRVKTSKKFEKTEYIRVVREASSVPVFNCKGSNPRTEAAFVRMINKHKVKKVRFVVFNEKKFFLQNNRVAASFITTFIKELSLSVFLNIFGIPVSKELYDLHCEKDNFVPALLVEFASKFGNVPVHSLPTELLDVLLNPVSSQLLSYVQLVLMKLDFLAVLSAKFGTYRPFSSKKKKYKENNEIGIYFKVKRKNKTFFDQYTNWERHLNELVEMKNDAGKEVQKELERLVPKRLNKLFKKVENSRVFVENGVTQESVFFEEFDFCKTLLEEFESELFAKDLQRLNLVKYLENSKLRFFCKFLSYKVFNESAAFRVELCPKQTRQKKVESKRHISLAEFETKLDTNSFLDHVSSLNTVLSVFYKNAGLIDENKLVVSIPVTGVIETNGFVKRVANGFTLVRNGKQAKRNRFANTIDLAACRFNASKEDKLISVFEQRETYVYARKCVVGLLRRLRHCLQQNEDFCSFNLENEFGDVLSVRFVFLLLSRFLQERILFLCEENKEVPKFVLKDFCVSYYEKNHTSFEDPAVHKLYEQFLAEAENSEEDEEDEDEVLSRVSVCGNNEPKTVFASNFMLLKDALRNHFYKNTKTGFFLLPSLLGPVPALVTKDFAGLIKKAKMSGLKTEKMLLSKQTMLFRNLDSIEPFSLSTKLIKINSEERETSLRELCFVVADKQAYAKVLGFYKTKFVKREKLLSPFCGIKIIDGFRSAVLEKIKTRIYGIVDFYPGVSFEDIYKRFVRTLKFSELKLIIKSMVLAGDLYYKKKVVGFTGESLLKRLRVAKSVRFYFVNIV